MDEKILDTEKELQIEKAIKTIGESSGNFHLVISQETTAAQIAVKLRQTKSSDLLNFKPLGIIDRMQGKKPEAVGTPVILLKEIEVVNGELSIAILRQLKEQEAIFGTNRPKISKESISVYDNLMSSPKTADSQSRVDLLNKILAEKCLKMPTVILDTTPIDVMQNNPENRTPELQSNYDSLCKRKRAYLGESAKTFRAKTGAQIVIVSSSENPFTSQSGNNGMENGHDLTKINL